MCIANECVAVEGEDAEVDLGVGKIGRDTNGRNRDHRSRTYAATLLLENLGDVALDLTRDLLLTCSLYCFHIFLHLLYLR